ncbi:unnamed protein product, partial [Acanthocheilonema viteae]
GWVARFVRRNNITLQVTNSASTIAPKLINSSSNCSSNIIENFVNQTDSNSLCCNSSVIMENSSCMLSSPSTTSQISDHTVANTNMYCSNDITKVNATTTAATSTVATTTVTTNNDIVLAKKRRKNFTPKKIVPNDVICLAANNKTNNNTTIPTTTTITTITTSEVI